MALRPWQWATIVAWPLSWTLLVYRHSLGLFPFCDAWALLHIGSKPLRIAISTALSYHTIPVTHAFNWLLWRLFGTCGNCYQLLNLAQLAAVAVLLACLGMQLYRDLVTSLLAATLLLASAAFFDIPLWPVVGNFQSLAATLVLVGLLICIGERPRGKWWRAGLLAAISLLAFLVYEPTIALLPVGLFALLSCRRAEGWRELARQLIPGAAAAGVVGLAILVIKARAVSAGQQAAFLPTNLNGWVERIYFAERAVLAAFTLRGGDFTLHQIFALGSHLASWGSPVFKLLLVGWGLVLPAAATWAILRGSRADRLLVVWMALQLVITSLAIPIASRHIYLISLPAMLLLARVLCLPLRWRPDLQPQSLRWQLSRYLAVAAAAGTLVLLAGIDRRIAAELYGQAGRSTRQLFDLAAVEGQAPRPRRLLLVNAPNMASTAGIALAFGNGLEEAVALASHGRVARPEAVNTATDFPRRDNTRNVDCDWVRARSEDPESLVVAFDPQQLTFLRVWPGRSFRGCIAHRRSVTADFDGDGRSDLMVFGRDGWRRLSPPPPAATPAP